MLPESLHSWLAEEAEAEGVSLNTFLPAAEVGNRGQAIALAAVAGAAGQNHGAGLGNRAVGQGGGEILSLPASARSAFTVDRIGSRSRGQGIRRTHRGPGLHALTGHGGKVLRY